MEAVLLTLKALETIGITPMSALLLAVVYLMGAKMEILPKPRWMNGNGNGARKKAEKELGGKMDRLVGHFNHDITDALKEIQRGQQKTLDNQSKMQNTLENIEKYGVKLRK